MCPNAVFIKERNRNKSAALRLWLRRLEATAIFAIFVCGLAYKEKCCIFASSSRFRERNRAMTQIIKALLSRFCSDVLELRNFLKASSEWSNSSDTVVCVCVSACTGAASFNSGLRSGECTYIQLHMAWVFYFACSVMQGNAKASRRGTSGEFGTTLFVSYHYLLNYQPLRRRVSART